MAGNTNSQYLESKVFTASQPRLHLMLLEAGLRQCRVAHEAGAKQFWGEFDASMEKAMDIIEELVRSVTGQKTEISKQLEEQYAFLFRELTTSRFSMDLEKLSECAKLLDFERETWKLACDKTDVQPTSRPNFISPNIQSGTSLPSESFSFEA
jgi:flagellar secretion chaperone FliS